MSKAHKPYSYLGPNKRVDSIVNIEIHLARIDKTVGLLQETLEQEKLASEEMDHTILKYQISLQKFIAKKEMIEEQIRKEILSLDINLKPDVETQVKNLQAIEREKETLDAMIKFLESQKINKEATINTIGNNINYHLQQQKSLLNFQQLNYLKVNDSTRTLDDIVVKPKGLKDLVKSYNNPELSVNLLDKIIFFKGDTNSGKYSAVKAVADALQRPIFRIKYEDFFNDRGLHGIFLILIDYLREQKKLKQELMGEYNDLLKQIEKIDHYSPLKDNLSQVETSEDSFLEDDFLETEEPTDYDPLEDDSLTSKGINNLIRLENNILKITDSHGNEYDFDISDPIEKKQALQILEDFKNDIRANINVIEDSCILYIDNLEQIIHFSRFDKGELLGPIKYLIEEIKMEDHNVLLILGGKNLGNNHDDFKNKIDRVIDFDVFIQDHQTIFDGILSKYCTQENIADIPQLRLKLLPKEYINIQTFDRLAKLVIKKVLQEKTITQERFDNELDDFIAGRNSLFTGIGLNKSLY